MTASTRARAKVLLFGSTGQLGVELVRRFSSEDCELKPMRRDEAELDRPESIRAAIEAFQPTLVVNSAAYNLVDQAEREPDAAYAINGLAVCAMAQACRATGAKLLHISTDYVFDGEAGRAYTEADPTHPISAYGVSKLAGELYAQAYLDDVLIIRTCGVFGPAGRHTPRGNFPETMLRLAQSQVDAGKPIRVVNDAQVSPTYAPALADRAVDLAAAGASGLFHIGGGEAITWYDYALRIFATAGVHPAVEPVDRHTFPTPARRPRFSALSNRKADAVVAPMPSLDEAIRQYIHRR